MAVSKPIRALAIVSAFLLFFLIFQVFQSARTPRPPQGSEDKIPEMTGDPNNDRLLASTPDNA